VEYSGKTKGKIMLKELRPAVISFLLLTLLTGIAYPLLVTGISQATMSGKANGSLIMKDGKPAGSSLIGQPFSDPKYFWGRPSATGPVPNNAGASSGSNLGPTNPALMDAVKSRVQALRDADPGNTQPVPVDLVTASGSGLDPHISPAAAEYQLARVARVRNLSPDAVRKLVAQHTEGRQFGILGEPRVDVLELNQALDAAH
jgi:K+-transporting ATPase ATPase C chain